MTSAHRPTGTVTFLFTDIEASTGLWERQPDDMRRALECHDAILRAEIEAHDGYVFSTAGDAFSAAFRRPLDAARSAVDAQRRLLAESWQTTVPLRVRMGIHVGAAQERDGDYFGPALNRAARLMALAHGGQVLVSLAAEELLRDDLPGDLELSDLGEHVLRGLSRPELVFQLSGVDLATEFPPLGAATSVPNNLPTPPTSFVGRQDDIKQVAADVVAHRLVTLVGPGGVGKTRLCIEAATASVDDFPDGIWVVELAPLAEAEAVIHAVAGVLSVSRSEGSSLLDSVVASLEGRRVLLALDNCEHVVDATSKVVEGVRRGAPGVTVLATSREPLGLPGERVWDVAALEARTSGVELFCQRAESSSRSFVRSEDHLELISVICERLDGMPLAIELAASRVRSMSLAQLARGLDDRFRLLRSSGRGGVTERHQTLQATIEWSYRLLGDQQRLLFDRLSVFAGSFGLDAVEAVCGTDAIEPLDMFDVLSSLVDKSLVLVDASGAEARYRLLETLRQYGAERLAERGDTDALRDRHLAYFTGVATIARKQYEGSDNAIGRATFDREWDNLRAALERAEQVRDLGNGAKLLRSSFSFAFWTGRAEHDSWTQRFVGSFEELDTELLAISGFWIAMRGGSDNYRVAEELGLRAIEAADAADHGTAAQGWFTVTVSRWYAGRADEGWTADRAAKRAAARHSDPFTTMTILAWSSPTLMFEPEATPALVAAAAVRVDGIDNATIRAYLAYHRGNATFAVGDHEEAHLQWSSSAQQAAIAGDRVLEIVALTILALRAPLVAGDNVGPLYRDLLERIHALEAGSTRSLLLTGLADWWASNGRIEEAARIIGFLGGRDSPATVADLREHAAGLVTEDDHAERWLADGAAMSRDEIVAYALDRLSEST